MKSVLLWWRPVKSMDIVLLLTLPMLVSAQTAINGTSSNEPTTADGDSMTETRAAD